MKKSSFLSGFDAAHGEAVLRAILETAVDGIVTIDEQGLVQSANPAAEKLFGYSAEELIGHNVKILMNPPDRDQHDRYLQEYLRTGQAKVIGIGREVCGRRKDGSEFPLDLSVSEWTVDGQRFFTGLLRDATQRRRFEQQLAELNSDLERRIEERTQALRRVQSELLNQERLAALGKIAGGISHEIRNPLNAIKTSAYFLLRAEDISAEKLKEHLRRIDRQVTLANEVVSALTSFARLPAPLGRTFDVGECVREAVETTELPDLYEVTLERASNLPLALGDPSQIQVAIRNLLRNARDAMPQGGPIRVEVSHDSQAHEIVIGVHDRGRGLSEDQRTRVTEPLYTTKHDGLGLGLAITVTILQYNQGQLSIDSTPEVGSTFRIHLPTAGSR